MTFIDDIDLAACCHKDRAQTCLAYTMHRIQRDLQSSVFYNINIYMLKYGINIVVKWIDDFDSAIHYSLLICSCFNFAAACFNFRGSFFDNRSDILSRVLTAGSEYLDTVVERGIMACCYRHAVRKLKLADSEHNE